MIKNIYTQCYDMADNSTERRLDIKQLVIRESIVPLAFRIFLFQLLFGGILYGINFTTLLLQNAGLVQETLPSVTVVYMIMIITFFIIFVYAVIAWRNHYYIIDNHGITHRFGVFSRDEQYYSCSNIETIELHQGFWGRQFKFGTIKMYDPALQRAFYLYDIGKPRKNIDILISMFLKEPPPSGNAAKQVIVQQEPL